MRSNGSLRCDQQLQVKAHEGGRADHLDRNVSPVKTGPAGRSFLRYTQIALLPVLQHGGGLGSDLIHTPNATCHEHRCTCDRVEAEWRLTM